MTQSAMPRRPFLRRTLLAAALASGSACSEPERVVLHGAGLGIQPSSVVTAPGESIAFEAALYKGLPATSPVRWRSSDSTIFRLDTTTTSPHRVIGRAGRAAGVATLTVTSGNEVMSIPITVIPAATGRTR